MPCPTRADPTRLAQIGRVQDAPSSAARLRARWLPDTPVWERCEVVFRFGGLTARMRAVRPLIASATVIGQVSPLVLAIIAGVFTLLGVLLKIGYDWLAARRASKKESLTRFAPERRDAYERFLDALTLERGYWAALHDLNEAHRRGEAVPQDRMDNFPPSPMKQLVDALDEVRRVGRTYAVISAAENIVRLFADMAAASRLALTKPGPHDEITWFLLQRLQEDRIHEFIHAYREDLGIGPPVGGPKKFPIPERPWPTDLPEAVLRAHLQTGDGAHDPHGTGSQPRQPTQQKP